MLKYVSFSLNSHASILRKIAKHRIYESKILVESNHPSNKINEAHVVKYEKDISYSIATFSPNINLLAFKLTTKTKT
jgi:hypothetical protein